MVPFRIVKWFQRSLGLRPRFRRVRRRRIAGLSGGYLAARVIDLEPRILPAAAVTSLGDMNGDTDQQNASSNANGYATIGTKTFFTYNSQVTNKPILAFKDSTTPNALPTILPDQTNFRFSPNTTISELTVFQGKLFFVATDGNQSMGLGKELWSYDPAAPAASAFKCITDYDGVNATNVNGTANGGINAKQTLTDGTTTLGAKNEGSAPANLTVSNGKLYFTATPDTNGLGANRELYWYDGTQVKLVLDINTDPTFNSGSSTPLQLTNANDVYLYFTAVDKVTNGRELWRTDGTAAGTIPLGDNAVFGAGATNIRPGGQDAGIAEITPAGGGVVYFSANDGSHGYELWRSDGNNGGNGSTTGTFQVKDIQPVIAGVNQGSNPTSLLFMNGKLYFAADDGAVGKELWVSTGALGNATLIKDIAQTGPGGVLDVKQNSNPHNLTQVGTNIYFSANDGLEGFELWKLDTTNNAVTIVSSAVNDNTVVGHPKPGINKNLTSSGDSTASSYPGSLLNVNGTLYFVATDTYTVNGQTNFELYKVNGAGQIVQVNAGNEQNKLVNEWQSQFQIPDPQQDFTYAKASADSFHPTEIIQDKSPTGFRTDASNKQLFLGPNGLIYFTADNGANGSTSVLYGDHLSVTGQTTGALGKYNPNFEPWTVDTANADATKIVQDMTVQTLTSLNPFGFTTATVTTGRDPVTFLAITKTVTFFFFTDPRSTSKNIGLAYTDANGVTTDTGLRFDSIGTTERPNPVVFGNNSILFIANGKEVWRTNGTMTGTECVATADISIDLLTVSGNRYFYYGTNWTFVSGGLQPNGELWSGRNSNEPAQQVQEIAPVFSNSQHSTGTLFITPRAAGGVWFNANDFGATNNGSRDVLWVSSPDDNSVGTRIVVSGAAAGAANPTGPQGPRGPFAGASSVAGSVVYFTNGTTLYRSQLLFNNGAIDAAATDAATIPLINTGGFISDITAVTNGVYFVSGGNRLYFSDGTNPASSVLVGTFNSLSDLKVVGNRLYFVDNGSDLYTATTAPGAPATSSVPVLVNTGLGQFNLNNLTITGDAGNHRLYFSAETAAAGQELWFTTVTGAVVGATTKVTDTQAGAADSLNFPFDEHSRIGFGNGLVFYGANNTTLSGEILYSATVGSTTPNAPLNNVNHPTTASSSARDFIVYDQDTYGNSVQPTVLFFSDVGPQRSVFSQLSTDPLNPSSTLSLTNIDTYRDWGGSPGGAVFFDDYSAAESQSEVVPQQYYHNGEYGHPQSDFGIYKSGKTALANRNGYLGEQFVFFSGFSGDKTGGNPDLFFQQELYVLYQGYAVRISDLRVASNTLQGNANPGYLTSIGNDADGESTFVLFAAAPTGSSNGALYKVTTNNGIPTTWATGQISNALNPRYLQSLGGGQNTGGKIYFTAGPENARTAWVTDGFTTTQLSPHIVDESAGDGKIFGFANGKVYFSAREANANTDNFELHMTDHATGATVQLLEINNTGSPGNLAGSRPGNFTNVNGTMYFAANDGINGFELWKTDGTAAGTVMVQDIEPGAVGSNPGVVISTKVETDLNGVTTSKLVYTYQGFAVANTRPDEFGVTNAGINSPNQQNPAKPNSGDDTGTPTLMFAATTKKYGRELMQVTPNTFAGLTINGVTYSGNAGKVEIVKDIAPGVRDSNPVNLTAIDGTVYYSADDGLSGDTLWRSIGMDQLTGNTLTIKLTDDKDLLKDYQGLPDSSPNSARTNGLRNPDDFTFLSTDNKTINRLIFTAGNDLGKTEVYTLNINHTPTQLNMTSAAVPENLPQGTVVGTMGTTDPDFGDSFKYQFVAGAGDTDNNLFQIVGTSLQIKSPLDFEQKSSYTVRIRTTDQRGQFYEKSFTVNVTDVNESPTGLDFFTPGTNFTVPLPNDSANIDENTPIPTDRVLADLQAIDADTVPGQNTFTIVPGLDSAFFTIDSLSGFPQLKLKAGTVLDYEAKSSYQVVIQVDDPSVAPLPGYVPPTLTFTLNVNDLDEYRIDAIQDDNPAADQVTEGAANGTKVGIIAHAYQSNPLHEPDGADVITYTLTNNAGGRFDIVSTTDINGHWVGFVVVKNGALLDAETNLSHTITVLATSSDGSTATQDYTITVLDNPFEFSASPIVDTNANLNQVLENTVGGPTAFVGITAFSQDLDVTQNGISYFLLDSAGGRFQIDQTTGVVTVKPGAVLDRETAASYDIIVQAYSQDGSHAEKTFTINLIDQDEFDVGPITDTDNSNNGTIGAITYKGAVDENAGTGTPVGLKANAVDQDATNSGITYTLSNNAGGRFTIDQSGVVTVLNGGSLLDAEQSPTWNIVVKATSQDGSFTTQVFTILINDKNEFSVGPVSDSNSSPNTVPEGSPNGTLVGITAKATDLDVSNNTVSYTLTDDAGGRFQILDPLSGVVSVKNGTLLDREAAASWNITVKATSSDGSTSSATFLINLSDVDEFDVGPISDTNPNTDQVNENAPNGTLVGITAFAKDADATTNAITYTLTDNAGGRFAINPSSGAVTVANGSLLDRETAASYTITVKATSADGSSSTKNFVINLLDVNDNPISNITDTNAAPDAVNENAPNGTVVGITAFAKDPDFTNNTVTYSLQDASAARYAINPTTGVVTVLDGTRIDFETQSTNIIIVKATSSDGSSKTQQFVITVKDVAEAPTIVLSSKAIAENMPVGSTVGTLSVKDAIPTAPVYTLVSGAGSNDNSKFSISGNVLKTKASFNFEAKNSYSIRVQVKSSNGITLIQTFTISVTNVNEAPTALTLSSTSIAENNAVGAVVGTLTGTDPDLGDSLTYSLVSGVPDNAAFTIVGNQLRANVKFDYETKKSYSIAIRVTDLAGNSFQKTFTITIVNTAG